MKKYKACIHAANVGNFVVHVHPDCPQKIKVKDKDVSSKSRCNSCPYWTPKASR